MSRRELGRDKSKSLFVLWEQVLRCSCFSLACSRALRIVVHCRVRPPVAAPASDAASPRVRSKIPCEDSNYSLRFSEVIADDHSQFRCRP
jgi:hypothetical protein